MLDPGVMKRYASDIIARQLAQENAERTNTKQPVQIRSDERALNRYLRWDLSSRTTTSYGLDRIANQARMDAYQKNTSGTHRLDSGASIDRMVDAVSVSGLGNSAPADYSAHATAYRTDGSARSTGYASNPTTNLAYVLDGFSNRPYNPN